MNRQNIYATLTLVLLLTSGIAYSAPHSDAPESLTSEEPMSRSTDPAKAENISITVPQKRKETFDDLDRRFDKEKYYYPYKQELAAHFGAIFGIKDSADDEDENDTDRAVNFHIGFSWLLSKAESPKWELGIGHSTVGHGHIWFSRRTIFNEKRAFRPYYEYGIMHKFVPKERMASFSDNENYLARVGIGFADTVSPPKSVQAELELAVGVEDILIMLIVGYAWGI